LAIGLAVVTHHPDVAAGVAIFFNVDLRHHVRHPFPVGRALRIANVFHAREIVKLDRPFRRLGNQDQAGKQNEENAFRHTFGLVYNVTPALRRN
jgi:hypothetical protein